MKVDIEDWKEMIFDHSYPAQKKIIKEPIKIPSSHVDHPSHYNQGSTEVINVIEDWNLGFHCGNAIKYIARHQHKNNNKQDIEKAIWYLQRYLGNLDGG